MHLYNAWLPPPIVQETKKEKESFRRVVDFVKDSYHPQLPDSVYSTLKWVPVLHLVMEESGDGESEDCGWRVWFSGAVAYEVYDATAAASVGVIIR